MWDYDRVDEGFASRHLNLFKTLVPSVKIGSRSELQMDRPGPLEIQNLPCRIRQFSAERLVAEDLSNVSKQPYPLSQLYWSINRSILRSIGRERARSRRLAAFEYWQLFWICTRGRQQMLCPVNISTDRHEAGLRAIRLGGLAIPRRLCVAIRRSGSKEGR